MLRDRTRKPGRIAAEAAGVSLSAAQRVWQARRPQHDRVRAFKRSNDMEEPAGQAAAIAAAAPVCLLCFERHPATLYRSIVARCWGIGRFI